MKKKPITFNKPCQVMNENMRRCRREAIYEDRYALDYELHGTTFVTIFLCEKHYMQLN